MPPKTLPPPLVALACGSLALHPGCYPACGTYTSLSGMEMVSGGETYDMDRDDMFESCGAGFGAFGNYDLMGDGRGSLVLMPDHRNMEIDTHVCTAIFYTMLFDNETLVVGQELALSDAEAGIYAVQAVPLVSGAVEVIDEREPDEECSGFREQDWKLSWDLEFANNGGTIRYTAQGKDWVGFTLPDGYEGC